MLDIVVNGFDIEQVVGNVFYVILVLIVFDIFTGILASAKERKINSSINLEGLIHKVGEIIALAFITFVDAYLQADGYIVKIGVGLLIVYEGMSIIENFSRIGIDLNFLTKYFDKDKVGKRNAKKRF